MFFCRALIFSLSFQLFAAAPATIAVGNTQKPASQCYRDLAHFALRESGHPIPESVEVLAADLPGRLAEAQDDPRPVIRINEGLLVEHSTAKIVHTIFHEAAHIIRRHASSNHAYGQELQKNISNFDQMPNAYGIHCKNLIDYIVKVKVRCNELEADLMPISVLVGMQGKWNANKDFREKTARLFKGISPLNVVKELINSLDWDCSVRTDYDHPTGAERVEFLRLFLKKWEQDKSTSVQEIVSIYEKREMGGKSALYQECVDQSACAALHKNS